MTDPLFQELVAALGELALLPDKPEESADNTVRALWLAAAGTRVTVTRAAALPLPALTPEQVGGLRALVEQRRSGCPLAHLTGRQEFLGIEFHTDSRALIPRRETELLAGAALRLVQEVVARQGAATVIDVCTGAGNVALSIAHHAPQARVFAADLSAEAVELARHNRDMLGLADRVEFAAGDLFAPFQGRDLEGRVDVVTCNPPYISSQNVGKMAREISGFEPRLAFDGGPFGVGIIGRVLTDALNFLRPGGWLCMEVGKGQGEPMTRMVRRNPAYGELRTSLDAGDSVRSLQMQKV